MLEVEDIHTYYGDSYVIQGVSLRVPEHAVVAVLGRNGVGKTTLVRSIIGFTPPRRGSIRFKGVEISRQPAYKIVRAGIGLVPQGRRIFRSLTVRENLEVASLARPPGRASRWTPDSIGKLFPRLRERASHAGVKLSGGEQQMLAIARALLSNPELLLLDEPTEGLAPLLVRELHALIRTLKDEGFSILLIEQNLPFALTLADHVHVMSKGRIVYDAPPADLMHNEAVKSRYLGI
ncbi:MAG: ABC transporter ATP-binding protein [Candidatus Tectomicrobia bacterium]|nr:ABC transporter ATP-binding protein [Candidatus Tectomicrobia bacterium]